MRSETMRQLQIDMQQCIQECQNCHNVCLATAHYCLQKGGKYSSGDLVGLLLDCAEICQTSANFMLRASPLLSSTCKVGSEVCDLCAASCVQLSDDYQVQACAVACQRCADTCRQIGYGSLAQQIGQHR